MEILCSSLRRHFLRGEPSGGVAICQLSSQGTNVRETIHRIVNFRAPLNEIFTDLTSLNVKKKTRVPDGFCGHGNLIFNRVDIIINVSFNFRILSVRMLSRIGMHVNCESRSYFFFTFFYMCWHEAIFLFLYIAMVNKFA